MEENTNQEVNTTTTNTTTNAQTASNLKGLSIAGMVCGIVAVVFIWTGWFGLISGIAAIVLSSIALAKKAEGKGMAIAGLVTGIVAMVIALIVIIIAAAAVATVTSAASTYSYLLR